MRVLVMRAGSVPWQGRAATAGGAAGVRMRLTPAALPAISDPPYSEWRRERALRCHSNRPIERWVLVLSPSLRTLRRGVEDKVEFAALPGTSSLSRREGRGFFV